MTDIVERLRERAHDELDEEAADQIERLQAQGVHLADALYAGQQENERLRAQWTESVAQLNHLQNAYDVLMARSKNREAEIETPRTGAQAMIPSREQITNLKKAFAEHDIPWPRPKGITLYWHSTGPLMRYVDGMLHIEALNPELKTKWRMSRLEMIVLGWRCIVAGLLARRALEPKP